MSPCRALHVLAFLFGTVGLGAGCASAPEASSDDVAANVETEDPGSADVGEVKSALMRGGLGANGDSCTVRTNPDGTTVPGTEKDLECCSTADPTDCVVILKPFPKSSVYFRY
jgi:hypothetical protein